MTLVAHPVPGKAKAVELCQAFIAGAPKTAEGHVFYGVKEGNRHAWQQVLRSGEPYYWIDGSYFDCTRNVRFRVTLNRQQHTGLGDSDGQRFRELRLKVLDEGYPRPPGWVVAVQQSEVFMLLAARDPHWLERELAPLRTMAMAGGAPIRLRPWTADKPEAMTTLGADLARASLLVTHSSAAAVQAVLAGVRVKVSPMSAAYSLGPVLPSAPERQAWASVLADNEFTREELRSGYAWARVHKKG
jgi:hypothetical protein